MKIWALSNSWQEIDGGSEEEKSAEQIVYQ